MGEPAEKIRRVSRKVAGEAFGVSRQRIEKLLKRWPDVETADGIDIEELKRLRDANMDPVRLAAHEQHQKLTATSLDEPPLSVPAAAAPSPLPSSPNVEPDGQGVLDFNKAKTRKEHANAQLAELKFAEESGRLVPRKEVEALNFAIARKLRDRINGFPTKMQQFLTPDAMAMITDECGKLALELQNDIKKLTAEEA